MARLRLPTWLAHFVHSASAILACHALPLGLFARANEFLLGANRRVNASEHPKTGCLLCAHQYLLGQPPTEPDPTHKLSCCVSFLPALYKGYRCLFLLYRALKTANQGNCAPLP